MHGNTEEIFFVVIGGTAIVLFLACVLIIYIVVLQKRQNRFLNEKEMLTMNYEQMLLQAQLEIQEQTLKNISQEIHDNIGQTLSLAKLNLNTVDLQKENAENKIVHSKQLVSKAIQDLRNLSRSLNTDSVLSSGLVKAIETELAIIEHAGSFKTEFYTTGTFTGIDSKRELILFRIVQEALNNIIKHSGARRILVNLVFGSGELKIEISDDGDGFEAGVASAEGQGLRNMKSRAGLIGGTFNVQTNPVGTTITVTLPIAAS